jgi:hypothetical protein
MKTQTIIRYNGSRFAGEKPASIETLLKLMELEKLNFENGLSSYSITPAGLVLFSGNFERVSHAFAIETDNKELLTSIQIMLDFNKYKLKPTDEISEEVKQILFNNN